VLFHQANDNGVIVLGDRAQKQAMVKLGAKRSDGPAEGRWAGLMGDGRYFAGRLCMAARASRAGLAMRLFDRLHQSSVPRWGGTGGGMGLLDGF